MSMSDRDPVLRLVEAGFPLPELTAEQRAVIRDLTDEELALLIRVKAQLDEAGADVQAHGISAGAGIF